MYSRKSSGRGFFAKVIADTQQQPKLTQEEIGQRKVDELVKLGELILIQHIVTYLKTLKDRDIDHVPTMDALDFAHDVVLVAQEKMTEAEKIGGLSWSTLATAWSLISDFKHNKELYVGSANTVVEMFGCIQVTEDTHIIWSALALRLHALHENTHRHLREDGTLDAGDKLFQYYTGMRKYDMIEPLGRAAVAVEAAVAEYHKAAVERRVMNK